MSRIRSPNYPSISLPTAVERIRALHKAEATNSVAREAIAQHLGFGGMNGASASMLSALGKYGLLEAAKEGEAKVSNLAMRILYPNDPVEKLEALKEAAFKPALFAELKEKWPERPPSDENLRSYLIRNGFAQNAVEQVIQFYRDTSDMVSESAGEYNEGQRSTLNKETPMEPQTIVSAQMGGAPLISLEPGKPFTVAFDGSVLTGTIAIRSVRDIDRLMKVLSAQKAAFEAMAEDDDPN